MLNQKTHNFIPCYPPRIVAGALLVILLTVGSPLGAMTRVRDIARPAGERNNTLMGTGIVVGLNGTGDGDDCLITLRPLFTFLQKMGNPAANINELSAKNVAYVAITAEIGRNGATNGEKIDVTIACLGKAKSLEGGLLLPAPLGSINNQDDTAYAWCEGKISLLDKKVPTTGIIKDGGEIEMNVQYNYIVDNDQTSQAYFDIVLDGQQANWQVAKVIAEVIEEQNNMNLAGREVHYVDTDINAKRTAIVLSPTTIRAFIPEVRRRDAATYIARVMNLQLPNLPEPKATIVINEKTGTIALTGNVEISSGIAAVGDLTITIVRPKPVPQPGNPVVEQTQWMKYNTSPEDMSEAETANIRDLVAALDQLNVPMAQKIAAIYSLDRAGVIRARIITE
ncbi:MAG: flagellar basal body P-ring protein FlgI [Phycisphaerae bacterium]|nr:flagellar basal body P-ring protein FlgI [Phycisphaerae bacterium]